MAITSRTDRIVRNIVRRTTVRIDRGTRVVTNFLQFKEDKALGANAPVVPVLQKAQLDMMRLTPISVLLESISSFCVTSLAARIWKMFKTKESERLDIRCSEKRSGLRV